MKHIKLFEEQIKLFPEYEKDYPDHPKDISKRFINKFKTHKVTTTNTINSWDEAIIFLTDFDNLNDDNKTENINSLFMDDEQAVDILNNMNYMEVNHSFDKFIRSIPIKNNEEILEKIKTEHSNDSIHDIFEYVLNDINIGLDVSDFLTFLIKDDPEFAITELLRTEYYNNLLYWVRERGDKYIYRAIIIPDKIEDLNTYLNDYDGIGEYWSYEESGAEPHSGNHNLNNLLILKAEIEANDINWRSTFYKSLYNLSDEREIQLVKDATIKIVAMEFTTRNTKMIDYFNKNTDYLINVLGMDLYKARKIAHINKGYIIDLIDEPLILKV